MTDEMKLNGLMTNDWSDFGFGWRNIGIKQYDIILSCVQIDLLSHSHNQIMQTQPTVL